MWKTLFFDTGFCYNKFDSRSPTEKERKRKMKKNVVKFLVVAFMFMLVPCMYVKAEDPVTVADEQQLIDALANGGVITLENDIAVTKPLHAYKEVTIDGAGFTLSADPSFVKEDTGNGSLITVHKDAVATFTNIKITNNAEQSKYGIQAYDGGIAVLDGVTIFDCKWGAILANGGGLIVNDLTLSNNPWGIEFGKGTNVTEDPAILMNGTIQVPEGEEQVDMLYMATNDQLEKIEFGTMADSEMSLTLDGTSLVLKDSEGTVVATSNTKEGVTLIEQETEEEQPEEPTTPTEPAEENPDTADMNVIAVITLTVLGLAGATFATKKLVRVR